MFSDETTNAMYEAAVDTREPNYAKLPLKHRQSITHNMITYDLTAGELADEALIDLDVMVADYLQDRSLNIGSLEKRNAIGKFIVESYMDYVEALIRDDYRQIVELLLSDGQASG